MKKDKKDKKAKTVRVIVKVSDDRRTLAWRWKSTRAIWYQMIARCTDPKHKAHADYGGRGITVYEEWLIGEGRPAAVAFRNFVRDVGLRPNSKLSLDRLDPNKGYNPDNVEWRTANDQARNKRDSIYLKDPKDPSKLIPAAELAARMGIRYQTLRYRLIKSNCWPGMVGGLPYEVQEEEDPT